MSKPPRRSVKRRFRNAWKRHHEETGKKKKRVHNPFTKEPFRGKP